MPWISGKYGEIKKSKQNLKKPVDIYSETMYLQCKDIAWALKLHSER